ncbi:MAG: hydantoinase/oxoprolinase family protein [Betaproteobacteria bacterium]|nr:hydantoinase/oxoprolinase family protein [Betaproteobacteria bacterium]
MPARVRTVSMTWAIGIDIGGTFTDLVAIDLRTGEQVVRKVLTTPREPLEGVLAALDEFERSTGASLSSASEVIHATTLATNTLLERKGARTALLTTRGFRDILETGREDRFDLYDLQIELQPPLIDRDLRLGITERIGPGGEILQPLDKAAVERGLRSLPHDVTSIAVCFLHSYANGEHERASRDIVLRERPDLFVSLSCEVAPIIREYERFVATAINAYVRPKVGVYLKQLTTFLQHRGFSGFVGIMKSDGGMCTPEEAGQLPARILESGPAAGILSATHTALACGESLAVAFDMGGTTAKACLVRDGHPVITDELEVARTSRFTKHSGLPLRLPSLELIEIGAGGGSIASISELGLLQVGPESAASEPGPACYGRGGDQPTVTDADLLLGYVNPDYFAGGTMTLDRSAAEAAMMGRILVKTGSADVTMAAWGVVDLVNENMAREIRLHCVEHGIDPASTTLIATGGAGPVHAGQIMLKLGMRRLIFPRHAGAASAVGLLLAPRSISKTITDTVQLSEIDARGIHQRLAALKSELIADSNDLGEAYKEHYILHMRVRGQAYELRVELPDEVSIASIANAFSSEHTMRLGRPPAAGSIEIVNWSATLTKKTERRSPVAIQSGPAFETSFSSSRDAYFGPKYGWISTPTVRRESMAPSQIFVGPMLIEDAGSTIVVLPGQVIRAMTAGELVVEAAD